MDTDLNKIDISKLDIPLERDGFLRELLRQLSGTLQDVVGLEEAQGFITLVGQKMGELINDEYKAALNEDNLTREHVSVILADLKQRIQGDFKIITEDPHKIIFQGNTCPFAEKVIDRPSLCMMTSNVFGTIASQNLGYAKVSLEETIARGARGCRVVVYLSENDESVMAEGIEYYKD
ncbi:MAG TPA: transcriptional regulator [Methylophaga aminisulfidivorans]|uniref:Transcriptional regulator n=2 Tax=root TaxID=1 RepID=A0A7C1ZRS3_9GAMM|nr:transcriptional regulator [Methylophaga aminisulfidivorans]